MNKYETALKLLHELEASLNQKYHMLDVIISEEEKQANINALKFTIKCVEEKKSEYDYKSTHSKTYREAQEIFNKINGHHPDHEEIYQYYCLRIEFQDEYYLVTYLDDSCVTLDPENPELVDDVEFDTEDKEYQEILQIIVDTGLTKVDW